ncbi:uncharacterized protein LOC143008827 [Genypterus blacodes]|uniref:uncharacterized protein LOC143008827 n=1 Tax=Genypterus blacodes TaxID=154954 RepID=UPI003F763620
MKREVKAGVNFLKRLALRCGKLDKAKAELFAEKLQKLLCDKYDEHWYPECPSKGQAFRCIRINNGTPCDEALMKACKESELTLPELGLPPEITLWMDPLEVCVRAGENSMPFTIASFEAGKEGEDDAKGEHDDDSANLETSDYHSATSSDCGSTASSDTEEEAKDGDTEEEGKDGDTEEEAKDGETEGGDQEKEKEEEKKDAAEGDTYKIQMVPRVRKRHDKVQLVRNMLPPTLQYFYHPAPIWPQYSKGAPVFMTTMCGPPPPPPPPPPVFSYYLLPPPPPPQFIMPQASLQPWCPAQR